MLNEKLALTQDDLTPYLLDLMLDKPDGAEDSGDTHLSLYVLRRNFWTWLESSTQLDDFDKRYVMGHEMVQSVHQDMRPRYNNEDHLYELLLKMDRCLLGYQFRHLHFEEVLSPGVPLRVANRGVVWVRIPPEQLLTGGTVTVSLRALEPDSPIRLTSLTPLRPLGGLRGSAVRLSGWPNYGQITGINCEYDNWEAVKRAQRGRKGG